MDVPATSPTSTYILRGGFRSGDMSPEQREARESEDPRGDWPQLVLFALLVGAILTVLLMGAVLRTDAPRDDFLVLGTGPARPSAPLPDETGPPLPRQSDPGGTPVDLPLLETELDRMARRSSHDVARLASMADGWTAQIGVFCDPSRVARLVEGFGDQPALFVLPSYHADQPCFRICWNRYSARADALRARDLPAPLRGLLSGDPLPRPVTEVLE